MVEVRLMHVLHHCLWGLSRNNPSKLVEPTFCDNSMNRRLNNPRVRLRVLLENSDLGLNLIFMAVAHQQDAPCLGTII